MNGRAIVGSVGGGDDRTAPVVVAPVLVVCSNPVVTGAPEAAVVAEALGAPTPGSDVVSSAAEDEGTMVEAEAADVAGVATLVLELQAPSTTAEAISRTTARRTRALYAPPTRSPLAALSSMLRSDSEHPAGEVLADPQRSIGTGEDGRRSAYRRTSADYEQTFV